jgi:hypothetical protein
MSNRFKRVMPLILDVQHFKGIRIHAGNSAKDTLGCPLVGINSVKGRLTQSKKYETELYIKLSGAKNITIEIK